MSMNYNPETDYRLAGDLEIVCPKCHQADFSPEGDCNRCDGDIKPATDRMIACKLNVEQRQNIVAGLLEQITDPLLAARLSGAIDRLRQADIEFERELAKLG
jgi:hypothetical protein